MTELAHTYIGNWISNSGLGERVEQAAQKAFVWKCI